MIDKIIHEPVRLRMMSLLSVHEKVDFLFLKSTLSLSDGNLSSHIKKLEKFDYIKVEKLFVKKKPKTYVKITSEGKKNLKEYIEELGKIINV